MNKEKEKKEKKKNNNTKHGEEKGKGIERHESSEGRFSSKRRREEELGGRAREKAKG